MHPLTDIQLWGYIFKSKDFSVTMALTEFYQKMLQQNMQSFVLKDSTAIVP